MMKITREELMQPFKCTCGKCGGDAYIIPALGKHGTCVCSKCTFGEDDRNLQEMELRILETLKEKERMKGLGRWLA